VVLYVKICRVIETLNAGFGGSSYEYMCLLFHPLFGNFLLADCFLIVSLVYIHKVLNSNL
jgi:hypothetical protein